MGTGWPGDLLWSLPVGMSSERNVKLVISISVLSSFVYTIAHGHLFTAFTYEIFGDNASVGLLESASGITALATAWPVGWAVDKVSRTRLLRLCAPLGLLAALTGALAVLVGPLMVGAAASDVSAADRRHPPGRAFSALLLVSLACWGTFFNTVTSAMLAIFADSVPRGSRLARQDLYATKSKLTSLAHSAGPLVSLVVMSSEGNSWKLAPMAYALLPGFALIPVMCWLMTMFEEVDSRPLDELQAGLLERAAGDEESGTAKEAAKRARQQWLVTRGAALVPYLLLAAEVVTSIGAGMTVKFFGLWFKNVFKFTPVGLALLQAATPVSIALTVQLLQRVSRRSALSPVVSMLFFWVSSIACLLAMVRVTDWRLLAALHLARTGLANCKEPLARAILADFVPSEKMGRWNAIHSLTGMTWTGSAALGGILCDRYGYGKTFVFTACLYICTAILWLPLIPLVPSERRRKATTPGKTS